MNRFYLQRDKDFTGISGTGRVLDGVQFSDGTVVVRWNTNKACTGIYDSIDDFRAIHVHNGNEIIWIDE